MTGLGQDERLMGIENEFILQDTCQKLGKGAGSFIGNLK
jgi:hypothetical protein